MKKKFVVETQYCITLDRIPEEFYPEIATNDEQRKSWVRLFSIGDIDGYSEPLTVDFLKKNQSLVLDTSLFDTRLVDRIVFSQEDLDKALTGIMVHADNFHALNLAQRGFNQVIKSIYIDPPYNTNSSSIPYKNNYKHSSFAAMMRDRIAASHPLLRRDGAIFVSIDKTERAVLEHALDEIFGAENHIEELIWTQATANSQLPNYSTNHEYVEVYASDRSSVEADKEMFREPKPGFSEVMDLISKLNPEYPSLAEISKALKELFENTEKSIARRSRLLARSGTLTLEDRIPGAGFIRTTVRSIAIQMGLMFQKTKQRIVGLRFGCGARSQQVHPRQSSLRPQRILTILTLGTTSPFIRLRASRVPTHRADGSFLRDQI